MALFLWLVYAIMSLSREVRIGMLVTIALIVFFTGFYFLKGSDILSSDRTYYCYYTSVDGLLNAAPLEIRGLNVGSVSALGLEGGKGVKVTFHVHKSIPLPVGTIATVIPDGFLGNKKIRLDLGSGPGIIEGHSVLASAEEAGLVDNMTDQMTPLMTSLRKTVNALDTVIAGVKLITSSENARAITYSLNAIKLTVDNLAALSGTLKNENDEIKSIIHNTNSITASFAKNNDTVRRILSNFNNVSAQLANSHIQKTFSDLQGSVSQLQGIMNKVNSNEGSLGLLINNKDLYNNMNSSIKSLDKLMTDLKEHPSRYINVTIFGKKKSE